MKLVDKVEGLTSEVQDTQQLIGALHGVQGHLHMLVGMLLKKFYILKEIKVLVIASAFRALAHRQRGLACEHCRRICPCLAGATAKQLQLVMQALTLAQAAKALALSASSKPAAGRSPAVSNGALASQVQASPRRSCCHASVMCRSEDAQ